MRESATGKRNRKTYLYNCCRIGISNTFNSWPRHWGTSVWKFQIYLVFLLRKCHGYEYFLKGQPVCALLLFAVCGHNDSDRRSVADLRGICINVNANHSKLVYIGLGHPFTPLPPYPPTLLPSYPISPLSLTPPLFCLWFAVWGRHITAGAVMLKRD